MDRKTFLKYLALIPLTSTAMDIKEFGKTFQNNSETEKMPVLFVGHGSPMNAIVKNEYSIGWGKIGAKLGTPKAILCISAHWLSNGTYVSVTDHPKTIHDFGGFPDELFKQQYPAPGAKEFAKSTIDTVKSISIKEDSEWGLDHGAWSVLMNMYPKANVPIFQMSIDYSKPPEYHFNLAKELAFLREKGVLIIGSGNVVHNLRMIKWEGNPKPFDWAIEFDSLVQKSIEDNNPKPLLDYQKLGSLATIAHPSNDHYLPLMYTLGLRNPKDKFEFFNTGFDMGSISMRSLILS